jgi:hypothetical protein
MRRLLSWRTEGLVGTKKINHRTFVGTVDVYAYVVQKTKLYPSKIMHQETHQTEGFLRISAAIPSTAPPRTQKTKIARLYPVPAAALSKGERPNSKKSDPYRGRTCDLGVISTTL